MEIHPAAVLSFDVLVLLLVCLFMFILFRHIEIRKVDAQNKVATDERPPKSHTKRDDIVILIHVVLIFVFLIIFMNEATGSRWVSILTSFVLITLISVAYLARSGSPMPDLIRERKMEYLALFSLLVFWAGAGICSLVYSILKLANGDKYAGPARIVGYQEIENDDDGGNNESEEEEEESEEESEENDDEDADEEEEEEEDNNDDNNRRKLEEEGGEGEEGEEEEGSQESGSNESGSQDEEEQASEYAYIKVAFGGSWGCPEHTNVNCVASIQTSCDMWDSDESGGYLSAETWKYGNSENDYRLSNVFSCTYGFEANDDDDSQDYYDYIDQSPDVSDDNTPYGYIIGDCNTCEADWAWTSVYRSFESMDGYNVLYQDYMILSAIAIISWIAATFVRTAATMKQSKRDQRKKEANLLTNEGGGKDITELPS